LKTLLAATEVAKTFRVGRQDVPAVWGVSMAVREGESLGVVGPSGSGKTTLARIVAGHLDADAGQVTLEGQPVSTSWRQSARRARRRIQLVAQDPWDALSPRLSVAELVAEPLVVWREPNRGERVAAVLERVGLPASGAFLDARSSELSGGPRQRIALARALVLEPKVLVADEPTAMLDASEQARLLVLLRELQVEMGLGLVLVSHDLAVVRKVTDRILVLDAGETVEDGPSARVSTSPQSATGRELVAAAPALDLDEDAGADDLSGGATDAVAPHIPADPAFPVQGRHGDNS
jgi:peptide/nickel transport system ATP-binding protein